MNRSTKALLTISCALLLLLSYSSSRAERFQSPTGVAENTGHPALTPTSQGVGDFKEYDFYYDGAKWVPTWFQCDEAREVAILLTEGKGKTFRYESFPKSDPSRKTVMTFRQVGDDDCGMMKCYSTLKAPGRTLVVFTSNYRDDDGPWTAGHSFVKHDAGDIPGRDCRMMDRSRLAVITGRRSIYVSESDKGVLEYRSYDYDRASDKPSVMLSGGTSSIDKSKGVETFSFQSGEYAYVLNVSTDEQRPSVEVLVKKNGALVQTEKCLSYNYLKKT